MAKDRRTKNKQPPIGFVLGEWTVLRSGFRLPATGRLRDNGWIGQWGVEVECSCGNKRTMKEAIFLLGKWKNCGHDRYTILANASRIHGKYLHPYYRNWKYLTEITNPECGRYKPDVILYDEWKDVNVFLEYMETYLGDKPSDEYKLGRINPELGFIPGNLAWLTHKEILRTTRGW